MTIQSMGHPTYRRELGDGLRLRWSTAADQERIAHLYSDVFRNSPEDPLNSTIAVWTGDLMSGAHPLLDAGDFAVVENTASGAIVASTGLMRQRWDYEGIPLAVGRPEIVATLPEYRNRGLVRAIFELIHARSADREDLAQGITGIGYYYRQFGYEYALDLDGARTVYIADIPKLKDGETDPYALRAATLDDLPQILALYDRDRSRGPVSAWVGADYWRWTLTGQRHEAGEGWRTWMIVNRAGQALGYVLTGRWRWGESLNVLGLGLEPGVALGTLLPNLLRLLQALALETPAHKADTPAASKIRFTLMGSHPVYDVLGPHAPTDTPYAWYVRVPDLPRLARQIAPALERRLAGSLMSGYSGELKIGFYRGGLRLAFAEGRLTAAEDWSEYAAPWQPKPQVAFPPLVFLQLLFGRRSVAELRHAFPDVRVDIAMRPLLDALFPARPSWVIPLD